MPPEAQPQGRNGRPDKARHAERYQDYARFEQGYTAPMQQYGEFPPENYDRLTQAGGAPTVVPQVVYVPQPQQPQPQGGYYQVPSQPQVQPRMGQQGGYYQYPVQQQPSAYGAAQPVYRVQQGGYADQSQVPGSARENWGSGWNRGQGGYPPAGAGIESWGAGGAPGGSYVRDTHPPAAPVGQAWQQVFPAGSQGGYYQGGAGTPTSYGGAAGYGGLPAPAEGRVWQPSPLSSSGTFGSGEQAYPPLQGGPGGGWQPQQPSVPATGYVVVNPAYGAVPGGNSGSYLPWYGGGGGSGSGYGYGYGAPTAPGGGNPAGGGGYGQGSGYGQPVGSVPAPATVW